MAFYFYLFIFLFSCFGLKAQMITGGSEHSVVLCAANKLYTFGRNQANFGALGDSSLSDTAIPFLMPSPVDITAISAGYNSSYALKKDSTVWAWGKNNFGQLGLGFVNSYGCFCMPPSQVVNLTSAVAITANKGYCLALKADSSVWAWGYNLHGELGDSTTINKSAPVQIKYLKGIVKISAGGSHGMALKSDGTVWTWGYNNGGQLGDGSTTARLTAAPVSGLNNVIEIAGGETHSLALKNDSTVWAWGYNGTGAYGNGNNTNSYVPIQIQSNIIAFSGSSNFSLFLRKDSTVWASGENFAGQLGDGTLTDRNTLVQVTGLANIISIAAGNVFHSLALRSDSSIWAWGYNQHGELGDGTFTIDTCNCKPIPVQVIGGICPNITLGMDENTSKKSIALFPNPGNGIFTLQSSETILSVDLLNVLGEKKDEISFHTSDNGETIVSLPPTLQQGIYFVKVKTAIGMFTKKIIVQR